MCPSAQDGVSVNKILSEILESGFYKNDYHSSTLSLLIKPVEYDEVVFGIKAIIDSKIFDKTDSFD